MIPDTPISCSALANAVAEDKRFRAARGSVSEREIDRAAATLRMATADRDRMVRESAGAAIKAIEAGN